MRTAIYYNNLGQAPGVIQVTGAGDQDGASTVAANLAISLAQTGKRVLLIDADLRQQRQLSLFGIAAPETGLATIVASDAEPTNGVCDTFVDNLWLLPAGLLPPGPCEIFTSPRFGELINLFRDSYDHVLIDTQSLLVSSDPCVIAAQTDGVVLTLSLKGDSRRRAKRAKEILDQLDVRIMGIVANRLSGAVWKRHKMKQHYHRPKSGDSRRRSRIETAVTTGG